MGGETQQKDHQGQEVTAEDCLDSSQSGATEGRSAVCGGQEMSSVLWVPGTASLQQPRAALHRGSRRTARCPRDRGQAASTVPPQHPQYTAYQGHASHSSITCLLPPDAANNHILDWQWLCCKWQSTGSRDILGLISLNSIQNDKAKLIWIYMCLCQVQQQPKEGTALQTFPELWLQCQEKISSSQLKKDHQPGSGIPYRKPEIGDRHLIGH